MSIDHETAKPRTPLGVPCLVAPNQGSRGLCGASIRRWAIKMALTECESLIRPWAINMALLTECGSLNWSAGYRHCTSGRVTSIGQLFLGLKSLPEKQEPN
jgi:hypothetical protein